MARQPTPVFFPGESHGLRSLAGHSPQGCTAGQNCSKLARVVIVILQVAVQSSIGVGPYEHQNLQMLKTLVQQNGGVFA